MNSWKLNGDFGQVRRGKPERAVKYGRIESIDLLVERVLRFGQFAPHDEVQIVPCDDPVQISRRSFGVGRVEFHLLYASECGGQIPICANQVVSNILAKDQPDAGLS